MPVDEAREAFALRVRVAEVEVINLQTAMYERSRELLSMAASRFSLREVAHGAKLSHTYLSRCRRKGKPLSRSSYLRVYGWLSRQWEARDQLTEEEEA
jgi:hypothetical protein